MTEQRAIRAGSLEVRVTFRDGSLVRIDLPQTVPDDLTSDDLSELVARLQQHPIDLSGHPPFHRAVWEQMRRIPFGCVWTYAQLAAAAGSAKAFRAVGQACGANPLPLLIPCHRVVATNGPGGFSLGMHWKHRLLELEGALLPLATPGKARESILR